MTEHLNSEAVSDYERIWLEPRYDDGLEPEDGRQWCQDKVWDDGIEYIRADLVTASRPDDGLTERVLNLEAVNYSVKEVARDAVTQLRFANAMIEKLKEATAIDIAEKMALAEHSIALTKQLAEMRQALDKLVVAVEFEAPAIRDGVGVEHRAGVLLKCAKRARATLASGVKS